MSRPSLSAAALLGALVLAAPAGVGAQQLEAPPPLAPLAAPPLPPAFQPPEGGGDASPGAPVLPPLSAPKPLIELPQTRELQGPARQGPPEPLPGQAGKDVIWLPTPEALVERMLTMAQVTPADVVYDLGSGDGRMVIAAAKRGAEAVGVEFNPDLVALSESRARVRASPARPASSRATSSRSTSRARPWSRCTCSRRSTCGCGPRC